MARPELLKSGARVRAPILGNQSWLGRWLVITLLRSPLGWIIPPWIRDQAITDRAHFYKGTVLGTDPWNEGWIRVHLDGPLGQIGSFHPRQLTLLEESTHRVHLEWETPRGGFIHERQEADLARLRIYQAALNKIFAALRRAYPSLDNMGFDRLVGEVCECIHSATPILAQTPPGQLPIEGLLPTVEERVSE